MDSTDNPRPIGMEIPETPEEAIAIQRGLREKVHPQNSFSRINTIAGADLAEHPSGGRLICGIILFSYPDMAEIERVSSVVPEKFPYIPGLLSFREGPAIVETFAKLTNKPDLLMIDGHGRAHPRGFGIASHVGVCLDVPTIGVAKARLCGRFDEPPNAAGAWTPLAASKSEDTIGVALRTKRGVKPVFVSIGHKIDLPTAVEIALASTKGYRVPEPTRQADIFVGKLKAGYMMRDNSPKITAYRNTPLQLQHCFLKDNSMNDYRAKIHRFDNFSKPLYSTHDTRHTTTEDLISRRGAMAERFSWVIPDKLAGMERPGLTQKYEADVEFLKEMGIGVIVNLEEYSWNYDGFEAKHIPVNDFRAPKPSDIEEFVGFVREKIEEGKRIVVHCYAGMGRTNLMIAAYFVSEGMTHAEALDYVKQRRPVFLVNDEQTESLMDYFNSLRAET